jgi:hypothetical protein
MTQNGKSNYEAVTESKQKIFPIPDFWEGYNKVKGYACWKCEKSQNSTHPNG